MTVANLEEQFAQPEGRIFGWGTTDGNGTEGWAPGAIFINTGDTNASINAGTLTTAVWKDITKEA